MYKNFHGVYKTAMLTEKVINLAMGIIAVICNFLHKIDFDISFYLYYKEEIDIFHYSKFPTLFKLIIHNISGLCTH